MKKDIEEFKDVQLLVRSFYSKVLNDEVLAHFFDFAKDHNWEAHLHKLDSFWNNVLFYKGGYFGNPLEVHKTLHYYKPLQHSDFTRWVLLFIQTLDDLFEEKRRRWQNKDPFLLLQLCSIIYSQKIQGGFSSNRSDYIVAGC